MIKLFAADMDGTLLGADHQISARTVQAIKDLESAGIEFMIATGRDYHSSGWLLKETGISCRRINLNGAAIYDRDGSIMYSQPMDTEVTLDFMKFLDSQQVEYSVMSGDYFYVADVDEFFRRINSFTGQKHTNDTENDDNITNAQLAQQFGNAKSLEEWNPDKDIPLKMMVISSAQDKLARVRYEWKHHDLLDITSSGRDNLEITHRQAQKGLALKRYITDKDYGLDQVATIGDSLNDRSMLEVTHNSYAMANAPDNIKKIATFQAPPNYEDGVAQVIESILRKL